jgi:hypothetical protein
MGKSAAGLYTELFVFGGRSFSIWNSSGKLAYDSGDLLERITAEAYPSNFNASNDNNTFDNRSDDKGPEPEGVVIGKVLGKPYAFIGLERIGGVAVFDVSDPAAPKFIEYVNNRNFDIEPKTLRTSKAILPQATSVPRDYSLLAMMRVQTAGRYWWWATRSAARLPSTKSRARGAEEIDKRSRSQLMPTRCRCRFQ